MSLRDRIKGYLIDLDGVVYQGGKLIPGAKETIAKLDERGIPYKFVTNTTRKPKRTILNELEEMGLKIPSEKIMTAPMIAAQYLKKNNIKRIFPALSDDALEDFSDFELNEKNPEAVIMGDLGDKFSYENLNKAFLALMGGADFVAIQKNKYWRNGGSLALDVGPFVKALEFASGVEAKVIGKPSKNFFETAAASIGLTLDKVAMIGDDIEHDIGGAERAGALGILVRTGKFLESALEKAEAKPYLIIESLANLFDELK